MEETDLENAILELCVDNFESPEEYRKFIVSLSKRLNTKLQEGAVEVLDEEKLKEYLKVLMETSYKGLQDVPSTPLELKVKERSKAAKKIIQEVLEEYKVSRDKIKDSLLKKAVGYILKSTCLLELRIALKLWVDSSKAVASIKEMQRELDELYLALKINEETEDEMNYLREQNEVLINALKQYDEDTFTAYNAHKLNKQGMSRSAIASELGISEKKVRTYLSNFEFDSLV